MKSIAVLMTCYNRVQTTLACLERLESCKDVRDQLVGAGRRRVAEFTWKRCATETACVYNRAYEEFIRL